MKWKTKGTHGLHKARFPAIFTSPVFSFRDLIGLDEAHFPALSTFHMLSVGVVICSVILLGFVLQQIP